MRPSGTSQLEIIYPTCRAFLDSDTWNTLVAEHTAEKNACSFEALLTQRIREPGLPEFLPGLARLESAIAKTVQQKEIIPSDVDQREINPTLSLIESSWNNLPSLIDAKDGLPRDPPKRGEEQILVWYNPKNETVQYRSATNEGLLVLKMITEDIDPRVVAKEGTVPIGAVEGAIDRAVENGLILEPRSLIRRDREDSPAWQEIDERFIESSFFTIQWHITQACDLHCRHCYDRSNRSPLTLEAGIGILDDLAAFCTSRHVRGQVSFSGGNPLLYPHFLICTGPPPNEGS